MDVRLAVSTTCMITLLSVMKPGLLPRNALSLPFRTGIAELTARALLDISRQAFDLQHLPNDGMADSSLTHGIRKC